MHSTQSIDLASASVVMVFFIRKNRSVALATVERWLMAHIQVKRVNCFNMELRIRFHDFDL